MGYSCLKPIPALAAAVAGVMVAAAPASALIITPTFTANFNTNFGANAAAAQAAWIAAAKVFTDNFTDPIHVNINVDAVTGTSVFGQSNYFLNSIAYSSLRAKVVTDATTPNDATAISAGGSMTAADPLGGAGTWWVTTAQRKALGIVADNFSTDGTTTFGTGNNFSFSGTPSGGAYNFQGIAAHEISEVMGRAGIGGGTIGSTTNSYSLIDNFAYTAANTKNLGKGAGRYFSFDGGSNLLKQYNNAASNGLDVVDWASGTNDAFNQFSSSNVINPVSTVDLQLMDVIGYDRVVPEPSVAVGLLFLGIGMGRRRRRQI